MASLRTMISRRLGRGGSRVEGHFVSAAERHGLEMIEYENFEQYYVKKYELQDGTKDASFVNGTFAFKKR